MILWGRRKNIAGFTFWSFRELNELVTTYSRHRRLLKMLVLPGGVDPNDLLYAGYSPSEASYAGGRRSMITSLILAGFENGAVPAGRSLLPHQRGAIISQERGEVARRSSELVAITMSPTRTDQLDSKTGKLSTTAAEWRRSHNGTKMTSENLFKQVDRRIDTSFGVSAIMSANTTWLRQCTGACRERR